MHLFFLVLEFSTLCHNVFSPRLLEIARVLFSIRFYFKSVCCWNDGIPAPLCNSPLALRPGQASRLAVSGCISVCWDCAQSTAPACSLSIASIWSGENKQQLDQPCLLASLPACLPASVQALQPSDFKVTLILNLLWLVGHDWLVKLLLSRRINSEAVVEY